MTKDKFNDKGNEVRDNTKGYIAAKPSDSYPVQEQFKGEVKDTIVRFPKDLGVEHPFSFEDVEKLYKSVGVVAAGVNKISHSIVGDFSIKAKNPKSKEAVDMFISNTDFPTVLREWLREGFSKGNGFMEIDIKEEKLKVNNANNMYVKRDKKGKVIGYNQFMCDLKRYTKNSSKLIPFEPTQIAHLQVNKIPGEAYGMGIIWPNEMVIENMVINESDLQKLISRKAGSPIHVKVGAPGEAVNPDDVDDFNDKLKFLTNRTEWVTDGNVDMSVIDFKDVGKNLTDVSDHHMIRLAYGMEIPLVLFGAANIPEGLANVQLEFWQREIKSMQEEVESIIEEQIFIPFLESKGLDTEIDFVWNLPGEEEINKRLERLTKIVENFNVSEPLRRMAELEIARLLNFEGAEDILPKPEKVDPEDELNEPGEKPVAPEPEEPEVLKKEDEPKPKELRESVDQAKLELKRADSGEMSVQEYVNLKEVEEFGYYDYLVNVLRRLRVDKFEDLAAKTALEVANGKFPENDITKLRNILKDGFRQNHPIKDIENNIRDNIDIKDIFKDEKITVKAELRPAMIARTETIRLANIGLVDTYVDEGIKKVRFLAALSERTCPICNNLNGQVFSIKELRIGENQPPLHPRCRCSLLSVEN